MKDAIERYYELVRVLDEDFTFLEFTGTDEDGNAKIAAVLKKEDGTCFVRPYTIRHKKD